MARFATAMLFVFFPMCVLSSEPAEFEILGVRLGASYETVSGNIRSSSKAFDVSEWEGALSYEGAEKFRAKLTAISSDKKDKFSALFSAPPDKERMVRAVRDVSFHADSAPLGDEFIAQLKERFGTPSLEKAGGGNPATWNVLIWARSPEGDPISSPRIAESCTTRSVYQAREVIALGYTLNHPRECGPSLKVYVSRLGTNPALVMSFQASLLNESAKRSLDEKTNALAEAKIAEQRKTQAEQSAGREVDF